MGKALVCFWSAVGWDATVCRDMIAQPCHSTGSQRLNPLYLRLGPCIDSPKSVEFSQQERCKECGDRDCLPLWTHICSWAPYNLSRLPMCTWGLDDESCLNIHQESYQMSEVPKDCKRAKGRLKQISGKLSAPYKCFCRTAIKAVISSLVRYSEEVHSQCIFLIDPMTLMNTN